MPDTNSIVIRWVSGGIMLLITLSAQFQSDANAGAVESLIGGPPAVSLKQAYQPRPDGSLNSTENSKPR